MFRRAVTLTLSLLALPAALAAVTVSGRVVDEDGVPIAGAAVGLRDAMLTAWGSDGKVSELIHLTDAEGRYEIADVTPGLYNVEVRAAGFAPAKVFKLLAPKNLSRFHFGAVALAPGASIEGRVTDADFGAIDGAEVTVDLTPVALRLAWQEGSPVRQGQARTDAEGRFVVADLLPGVPLTLSVTRAGYVLESLTDLRAPTEKPLAIVLERAGRLKGKVVDQLGEPIPGATVWAMTVHRAVTTPQTSPLGLSRSLRVDAGADGRFLIEVEPGTVEVTVYAEGYQRQQHRGIEVASGSEHELVLVLGAGAVIAGTITAANGEPAVHASVNVSQQRDGFFGGAWIHAFDGTDAEGRYRVAGAPTGPATLTVSHRSSQRLVKSIELQPGTNIVDLLLERGFEVSGRVVNPDGVPVSGAAVSIQVILPPEVTVHVSFGLPKAVSSADGSFTLSGLEAGNYEVVAEQEGYASARSEAFEVSRDVGGRLLELRHDVPAEGTGGHGSGRLVYDGGAGHQAELFD